MAILGTALLALCYLMGLVIGELLGKWIGVDANVGGVGFAMILLLVARGYLEKRGLMPADLQVGITFWAALYIPVVIAMAASQNVLAAVKGGPIALIAALLAVILCALAVALLNRTKFARSAEGWDKAGSGGADELT
jgi:malonate transporter MadL subunit